MANGWRIRSDDDEVNREKGREAYVIFMEFRVFVYEFIILWMFVCRQGRFREERQQHGQDFFCLGCGTLLVVGRRSDVSLSVKQQVQQATNRNSAPDHEQS